MHAQWYLKKKLQLKNEKLNKKSPVTYNMSHVICHISHAICMHVHTSIKNSKKNHLTHMYVSCHMSHVYGIYHMSHVTCHITCNLHTHRNFNKKWKKSLVTYVCQLSHVTCIWHTYMSHVHACGYLMCMHMSNVVIQVIYSLESNQAYVCLTCMHVGTSRACKRVPHMHVRGYHMCMHVRLPRAL